MKMDFGFRSGKKIVGLLLFSYVLLSLFSSVVHSSSAGIISYSSKPGSFGNCTSCHGGTLGNLMTITGANLVNALLAVQRINRDKPLKSPD